MSLDLKKLIIREEDRFTYIFIFDIMFSHVMILEMTGTVLWEN